MGRKESNQTKNLTVDFEPVIHKREGSGSVVECLTRDRAAAGSSLTGITVLCPWARTLILA